jgi:hypothetical protein
MKRSVFIIAVILLVAISGVILLENRRTRSASDAQCRRNLTRIYAAIQAYSSQNEAFPNSLDSLNLDASETSCPESHQTYLFLGAGARARQTDPAAMLVVDAVASHGGEAYVLYGDGQIAPITAKRLEGLLKLVRFRPPMMPRIPATEPATLPAEN